ncbi:IS3 family transposase [Fibrisoma limi]|uniref:IS3 family transposase n=1 Tax=Fibrisoma limi TaxID=663275 RepID=UPI0035B63A01
MVNQVYFETRHQAKLATFEYIEGWYNRQRKHSTLDFQTPFQCESYFFTSSMAA